MQKDIRKPGVQTIREMIEKNFTIVVPSGHKRIYSRFELFAGANLTELSYKRNNPFWKELANPNGKYAAQCVLEQHALTLNENMQPFAVLKESFLTSLAGWLFVSDSVIYFPLNEKIKKLVEGGFIKHWFSNHMKIVKQVRAKEWNPLKSNPRVFTMDHLGIGFLIWLECLAACIVVFVGEIITSYCLKALHRKLWNEKKIVFELITEVLC